MILQMINEILRKTGDKNSCVTPNYLSQRVKKIFVENSKLINNILDIDKPIIYDISINELRKMFVSEFSAENVGYDAAKENAKLMSHSYSTATSVYKKKF